jgi:hypothetical protein
MALAVCFTAAAQNTLSLSGTVFALPGSQLQNTVVIACLRVNDTCDDQRSGVQQLTASGSSARFQISNLENEDYLLLAWRDLNGNSEADTGDEVGIYQQGGKPTLLRPPASNLELRMARFSGDLDSLINQAEQPGASASPSGPSATPSASAVGNNIITESPLRFVFSSAWRNTGNGSYEAVFGEEGYSERKGLIRMQVFSPRAKSGALLVQARAIWRQESKGQYDKQGAAGGVYARRMPSGLNVAVTFGTLRSIENPNQEDRQNSILAIYTVMFLVEHGNQVIPIFFVLTRPNSSLNIYTTETEGRGLMLEVMNKLQSGSKVTASTLFSEADLIGKWKSTSGGSLNTNWYSPSTGAYVTSTFTASSFGQWMTLLKGGTGSYSQSLATSNNSGTTFQSQQGKMRWQLNGDFLTFEMIDKGFKQYYQLYGTARDDRGKPVILTRFLYNGNAQTRDALDGTPDGLWVVDN